MTANRTSIAVMNAKGGVGKSTTVMAMAETLAASYGKSVLVIDSDPQTSVSTMLIPNARWESVEKQGLTLADYLEAKVLASDDIAAEVDWRAFIAEHASDVDEAHTLAVMPSHMELGLVEREISAAGAEGELRSAVRDLLDAATEQFDIVLVDCPPGISVLTEVWLRECDWLMPPTKPDLLASRGLALLRRFMASNNPDDFADMIGLVINLSDPNSPFDEEWQDRLRADPDNACFETTIPRRTYIERASQFAEETRSYIAKYPGDAGASLNALAHELLLRMSGEHLVIEEPPVQEQEIHPPQPLEEAPVPAPVVAQPEPNMPLHITGELAPQPEPVAPSPIAEILPPEPIPLEQADAIELETAEIIELTPNVMSGR